MVYVLNLMTRYGQTNDYSAKDHLHEMEKYLGEDVVDYIIVNNSAKFPKDVLVRYKEETAFPVKDDLDKDFKTKVIRGNFIGDKVYERSTSDKLVRSLIRHDSDKLAKAIFSLLIN